MSNLRLGFLGTGMMGLNHVMVVRDHFPDVKITAVCDPHEPSLAKAREAVPTAQAFADFDKFLAADIDAIVISSPGFLHADQVCKCLSAGKHVLAEKPLATDAQDCQRIIAAADAHPKLIALLNHELRYSAYFQKIKDLVADGAVGKPAMVWCKEFRGPFLKKVGDWIQDRRLSGGSINEMNSHHFDLLNWWIGSRPAKVSGFGGTNVVRVVNNAHEVYDHATVSFEYANGVRGGLLLCMFSPQLPEDLELGIIGDGGILQTRMSRKEIHVWARGNSSPDPTVHQAPITHTKYGPAGFVEAHTEFFRCIQSGQRPLTDVHNCLDATLLGLAAEEAIAKGEVKKI